MIVVGLSSGTSVDGIDVAAADLSLERDPEGGGSTIAMGLRGHLEVPYTAALRAEILGALPPAETTMETVCRVDTGIGQEMVGFLVAVAVMAYLFLYQPELVGFTWYTAIGLAITMVIGWTLSLRHPRTPVEPVPESVAVE